MSLIVSGGNIRFSQKIPSVALYCYPLTLKFSHERRRKFEFFCENVPKTDIFSLFLAFLDNPLTLLLPLHFRITIRDMRVKGAVLSPSKNRLPNLYQGGYVNKAILDKKNGH